jgi:serine/threonine protein kinase
MASGAEGVLMSAIERSPQHRQVVIKKRHVSSAEAAAGCVRERIALQALGAHDNVVHLIEHIDSERWQFFVLEKMTCDLYAWITAGTKFGISEAQTRRVMLGVSNAVRYLHANQWSHNDIKPENILLDFEADKVTLKQAKLTDFGFCMRHTTSKMLTNTGHGTEYYMAPEVLCCCRHTSQSSKPTYDAAASDVFSLGATLFVALVGEFLPRNTNRVRKKIEEQPLSMDIRKLMLQMVERQPADRPTIREVRLATKPEVIDYSLADVFDGFEEAESVGQSEPAHVQSEHEDRELSIIMCSSPLKVDRTDEASCPSPVFDTDTSPAK